MDGGAVYLINNLVNSMRYVGQTKRTVEERFKEHAKSATLSSLNS